MKNLTFNEHFREAIIAGRKIETRRPLDPQPDPRAQSGHLSWIAEDTATHVQFCRHADSIEHCAERFERLACPYGRIGEIGQWVSAEHPPLALEMTRIRAERLHAINETGARLEGIQGPGPGVVLSHYEKTGEIKLGFSVFNVGTFPTAREAFMFAWDALYVQAEDWKKWAANPWVWVISFKVVG